MVNEFQGLTNLEFNPKGGLSVPITGNAWLDNFGIDVFSNKHIFEEGIYIMTGIAAVLLLSTFVILSVFQAYVK